MQIAFGKYPYKLYKSKKEILNEILKNNESIN